MFKEILLTIDLNDESSWRKPLPVAIEYCRGSGARLHVATVVPNFGMSIVSSYFPAGYEKKTLAKAEKALEQFVKDHVPAEIPVQRIVAHGTIYEQILATAKTIKADLIVIGSHRPELSDYLIGPNAARVVRHADCSVLVVRE